MYNLGIKFAAFNFVKINEDNVYKYLNYKNNQHS